MKQTSLIRNVLMGLFLGSISAMTPTSNAQTRDRRDGIWRINKDRWTSEDEASYSKFVQVIGESKCGRINRCLTADTNPYKSQNPSWMNSAYSDCADLPYVLRMYFAYMNDLPFSYQSQMSPRGSSRDIRYSANGNSVRNRSVVSSGDSLQATMLAMRNAVSTAMFRVPPETGVTEGSALFPDLYAVKIDRKSIQPGTNIYDPNGHVAVVYKVEADGRVLFMDAHPDNSLTRGVYGEKFIRSRPTSGAGFKNWRPVSYANGRSQPPATANSATIRLSNTTATTTPLTMLRTGKRAALPKMAKPTTTTNTCA